MTIPTPATPTGDSVTNPAGSVRADDDYMPKEGVGGFSLKQEPTALVDSALQVYSRMFRYADSRALHEAAMAYRAELIRIVTDHARERAAVEKALAAWDAYNETEESQWAIDEAMSALRAIHAETKGNL